MKVIKKKVGQGKVRKDSFKRKDSKMRALGVSSLICTTFMLLIGRLTYVMVYKGDVYKSMAEVQWESHVKVKAKRGDIVDRGGNLLATSIESYRVDLDLRAIKNYSKNKDVSMDKIAMELATASGLPVEEVNKKLNSVAEDGSEIQFSVLVKSVEKRVADDIDALKIYGTVISSNAERYYPNKTFLSHALGSVNSDNKGINGVELKYDDILTGIDGMRIGERDGAFNDLLYKEPEFSKAIDGKNLMLTIDENIQAMAEEIADKGLQENKAKDVSIIVMNPNNGEILALANTPKFDPNHPYEEYEKFPGSDFNEKWNNMFNNNLVNSTYEPGSTFKFVTLAAVLEEGLATENDTFDCGGKKMFGNTAVHCWKREGHGVQNLAQIFQNSCNVGFMDLGARLGKEKMMEYTTKLGFGSLTGVDLPGEANGILMDVKKITDIELGTIAFGQTNTVTGMQLINAFNAIANGGSLIQPHIMKEITHKFENGTTVIDESFKPETEKDVLSKETTAVVRRFLEQSINRGGKEGSFLEGYRIGGKTGTAQKPDPNKGGYAVGKYISSVIAMYPVENPQVTVLVKVNEPDSSKYYGSEVAEPLLKDLMTKLCGYMDSEIYKERYSLNTDIVIPEIRGMKIEDAKALLEKNNLNVTIDQELSKVENIMPLPGYTVNEGATITINPKEPSAESNKIMMPNLEGKSLSEASKILNSLGLRYETNGTGTVARQNVIEGQLIESGVKIKLDFK